jgi:hypothetical protein
MQQLRALLAEAVRHLFLSAPTGTPEQQERLRRGAAELLQLPAVRAALGVAAEGAPGGAPPAEASTGSLEEGVAALGRVLELSGLGMGAPLAKRIRAALRDAARVTRRSGGIAFNWRSSDLVKAMEEGAWVRRGAGH